MWSTRPEWDSSITHPTCGLTGICLEHSAEGTEERWDPRQATGLLAEEVLEVLRG